MKPAASKSDVLQSDLVHLRFANADQARKISELTAQVLELESALTEAEGNLKRVSEGLEETQKRAEDVLDAEDALMEARAVLKSYGIDHSYVDDGIRVLCAQKGLREGDFEAAKHHINKLEEEKAELLKDFNQLKWTSNELRKAYFRDAEEWSNNQVILTSLVERIRKLEDSARANDEEDL